MGAVGEVDALGREYAEIKKINNNLANDPDDGELWIKLVDKLEQPDDVELTKNSDSVQLTAYRAAIDALLKKYPLYYGYWMRYAKWEFRIGGTEASEFVYERAVAAYPISVDLWTAYCAFKMDTCHDPEIIRSLFERALELAGMDPNSADLWNKYVEYEERMEEPGKIIAILFRAIQYPSQANQDHFNRLRHMAAYRPIVELLPAQDAMQYLHINPAEVLPGDPNEQKIRGQIDQYYYSIFYQNQSEMTRRKDFETHIERPYFTTDEISDGDIENWIAYLEFEEDQDNYNRTRFLYERCLVACAYYDYFWARYYRWTVGQTWKTKEPWGIYNNDPPQPDKQDLVIKARQEETIRNIFRRASYYVPMSRTTIRMFWANWEESVGCVGTADALLDEMVQSMPDFTEAVVDRATLQRRHNGIEAGLQVFREYIGNRKIASNLYSKGWIVAEWAKLIWKTTGDAESARDVFVKSADYYLDVKKFWIDWLRFELEVPVTTEEEQKEQLARVRALVQRIRVESRIPPHTINDLCELYMDYLKEHGGPDAMAEWVKIDAETKGPLTVQTTHLIKLAADGKIETTRRRIYLESGHPGVAVNDPLVSRGHNPFAALYRDQGENPYDAGRDPLRIGHGQGSAHPHGHGHGPLFQPPRYYPNY